jgi:hypothetical protein
MAGLPGKRLHLLRQLLHSPRGLRIVLHHLAQLIQLAHALLVAALRVGGIARGIERHRPLFAFGIAIVARIHVAPDSAIRATTTAKARIAALDALLPAWLATTV